MIATRSPRATPSFAKPSRAARHLLGVVAPGALAIDAEMLGAVGDAGWFGARAFDEQQRRALRAQRGGRSRSTSRVSRRNGRRRAWRRQSIELLNCTHAAAQGSARPPRPGRAHAVEESAAYAAATASIDACASASAATTARHCTCRASASVASRGSRSARNSPASMPAAKSDFDDALQAAREPADAAAAGVGKVARARAGTRARSRAGRRAARGARRRARGCVRRRAGCRDDRRPRVRQSPRRPACTPAPAPPPWSRSSSTGWPGGCRARRRCPASTRRDSRARRRRAPPRR